MSLTSSSTFPDHLMTATTVNVDDEGHSHHTMAKRKRTKRRRLHDLPPPPPPTSTTTAASQSSLASSADLSGSASTTTTTEEEDMANCLILLARGGPRDLDAAYEKPTEEGKVVGQFVYECRTCNKTFPSFQALGGHRASHKKPKTAAPSTIEIAPPSMEGKKEIADEVGNSVGSQRVPLATFPKPRMHLCSICGLAFSSGQALGGHMRRHRPVMTTAAAAEEQQRKDRGLFSLDLNLPAPSDEDHGDAAAAAAAAEKPLVPSSPVTVFPFAGNPPPAMLFTSALVGCHY